MRASGDEAMTRPRAFDHAVAGIAVAAWAALALRLLLALLRKLRR